MTKHIHSPIRSIIRGGSHRAPFVVVLGESGEIQQRRGGGSSSSSSGGGRGQGGRGDRRRSSEEDYKITLRSIRKNSKRFDTDEQVSEMYARSALLKKAYESGMPAVHSQRKANIFMDGNPIVYGGAIDRIENDPKDGQVVGVFDHNQRPIGWGTFNSSSMFRADDGVGEGDGVADLIKPVVKKRIEEAKMLRDKVLDLKNGKTNAYRLVNSEGDRLSGIIIDKYGNDNHFVVSSSAGWVEAQRGDIIEALREVMLKENENMTVVWRRDVDMYALEGVGVTEKVSVYDKNGDDASVLVAERD